MSQQTQFLNVVDRDEAHRRFGHAFLPKPLGVEQVALPQGLGRILASDVVSRTNVPCFDRSNFDGFAVKAEETVGADENHVVRLRLRPEKIPAGGQPEFGLQDGEAASISTGGMMPRGANAVCLVENTEVVGESELIINRSVYAGSGITFAGTDISIGETVLRVGQQLSSRETGVLAAIGETRIPVFRRPKVAVISTGNEIIPPGEEIKPGFVYDSNARMIADAVVEAGGEPLEMGIAIDNVDELDRMIEKAITEADVVLLSGGTSKGEGDLSYQVVSKFNDPGIVVHGVALKPGKPICLAVTQNKPVVILPGFPTSAIFTFHEFVSPVIRGLAGLPRESHGQLVATLAAKANSAIGRTEYLLVGLTGNTDSVHQDEKGAEGFKEKLPTEIADRSTPRAFPMGKGSGSVTTFSQADGFITIDRQTEFVDADSTVSVQLISPKIATPDLVVIGSHCVGVDFLLSEMQKQGFQSKYLTIGSMGGLRAVESGDCDLAGIHLLDPVTGLYNQPFLSDDLTLQEGYNRKQGIVVRKDDPRFSDLSIDEVIRVTTEDPDCLMINRNQGSGTRILIDQLFERVAGSPVRPRGYEVQASNHHAVCAAVQQSRADWGVAIESVVEKQTLNFIPIADESYDFVIARGRQERPAVRAFLKQLQHPATRSALQDKRLLFSKPV